LPSLFPLAIAAVLIGAILYARRRVPPALITLMATAFVDMVGVLIVLPLLPFYARALGGTGVDLRVPVAGSVHLGIGVIVALLVTAFTTAQLLSAPLWGRFSDRFGRRPALLIALGASAIAYVVFAFAGSLVFLFASRLVQGAGGGTVGVIQSYVADSTKPEDRARSLGWLSAATNLGVFLGPALGTVAVKMQYMHLSLGASSFVVGRSGPGLVAALLCVVNMAFAWRFLRESHGIENRGRGLRRGSSRQAVWRVIAHAEEPASRLIWIYSIAIGAQQGITSILALFLAERYGVTAETIGYLFMYIGAWSVLSRALLLGKALDRFGEAKLSRIGSTTLAVGLATIPLTYSLPTLAVAVALIPLGTAFTFPCVTALLSRVTPATDRGLYMGVQQTFGGISRGIFPLLLGLAWDHTAAGLGRGIPFWISALFVAFTVTLGLGLERAPAPALG
jgi:MFS family permease